MKILVFPKDNNPYQNLLYSSIKRNHPEAEIKYTKWYPLIGSMLLMPILIISRMQGYKIIHIHWPAFGIRMGPASIRKKVSYILFIRTVQLIKMLNCSIIWTVHNVTPHENLTTDDNAAARFLSKSSKVKIVHSQHTIHQLEQIGAATGKLTIIPHGNYIGVYPELMSRDRARAKLNLNKNEVVILFFGLIRNYKGVDELLKAYIKIQAKNTRLLIVGKCDNPTVLKQIQQAQEIIKIDFYEGYVPQNNVALYFQACDLVCLPFKSITTSGSALLALSFAKPIIAPRLGALLEMPNNIGYFYDPAQKESLARALSAATSRSKCLPAMSKSALQYAKTLNWSDISEETYQLYKDLANDDGIQR